MDNFTNPENNTQNTTGATYSYDYMNNASATQTDANASYSQPGTLTGESAAWQANNQTEQGPVYTETYAEQYSDATAGYTAVPEKKKMIGFAIASLILGILAILCCCLGIWSWLLAIPGVVLGIITLAKKYAGKGCAIAGIICSALAIVLSLVMTIWAAAAGTSIMESLDDYGYSSDYYDYYY